MTFYEAMQFVLRSGRTSIDDFCYKWSGRWSSPTRQEFQRDLEKLIATIVQAAIAEERNPQDRTHHTRSQDHRSLNQPHPRSLASSAAFDKSGLSVRHSTR